MMAGLMRKLPWPEILVTALVVLAGVGVYLWAHRGVGDLEESKRSGAAIVAALEEYRDDNGAYPETLDMLMPDFLAEVPAPVWGTHEWSYRRYTAAEVAPGGEPDREYFQLSVAENASGYPVLYYDFTARRWVLNN